MVLVVNAEYWLHTRAADFVVVVVIEPVLNTVNGDCPIINAVNIYLDTDYGS